MSAITAAQRFGERPPRRVELPADGCVHGIASAHGLEIATVAQLLPFVVDDAFVTLLASAERLVRSADLITAMHAAVVRRPRAEEILLGFHLGQVKHTVYMDATLLEHQELLFCVDPPRGYAAAAPDVLREHLCARLISLPATPRPRAG